MKRITLSICAVLLLFTASEAAAQNVRAVKRTAGAIDGNSIAYSLPQTAVSVYLTVEREVIKLGPYARFAQKYLGVVAPLTEKEIHTLTHGAMSWTEEADPTQTYVLDNPEKNIFNLYRPSPEGFIAVGPDAPVEKSKIDYEFTDLGINPLIDERVVTTYSMIESDTGFVQVPVDRREIVEMSLEDMAADAAQTIFTLRKRRFDLVTGEAGEHVFGAGLAAAIEEMKRLEDEYLSLFLGKRFSETTTRKIDVVPESGKTMLIVCRFSDSRGILADNDLSGRPVAIEFVPENKADRLSVPRSAGKDSRGTVFYRIADMTKCRLMDDNRVLATERMPIYQFGSIVEVPVTSLK